MFCMKMSISTKVKTHFHRRLLIIQEIWLLLHMISHIYLFNFWQLFFLRSVHLCPQQEPKIGLLYVNVCSWKRVPVPQDPSKPLPLCSGKLETVTNTDQGKRLSCAASQAFVLHDINNETNKVCVSSFCRPVHCVRCGNKPCSATGK